MGNCVSRIIEKVESTFKESEFAEYLNAFKFDCQVRNLTTKTIECYFDRLGYFFNYLIEQNLTLSETNRSVLQNYIMSLKGNVSDETINGRLRVYRKFFNFLADEELWDKPNPMHAVKLLRTARRVKPVLETNNLQKLLRMFDKKHFEGHRNFVMILVFWDGMLRLNELLNIRMADIDLDARLIKVFGKGRKERMVPIGIKTIKALHQYLIKWRSKYAGDHLFCMRSGQPIKERHCHKIVQQIGQKIGIKLYPHLLRHSAATWYIQQGGNPAILQKILGHSSLLVTQNYLHLSNADTVKSYDSFSPSNCLRI